MGFKLNPFSPLAVVFVPCITAVCLQSGLDLSSATLIADLFSGMIAGVEVTKEQKPAAEQWKNNASEAIDQALKDAEEATKYSLNSKVKKAFKKELLSNISFSFSGALIRDKERPNSVSDSIAAIRDLFSQWSDDSRLDEYVKAFYSSYSSTLSNRLHKNSLFLSLKNEEGIDELRERIESIIERLDEHDKRLDEHDKALVGMGTLSEKQNEIAKSVKDIAEEISVAKQNREKNTAKLEEIHDALETTTKAMLSERQSWTRNNKNILGFAEEIVENVEIATNTTVEKKNITVSELYIKLNAFYEEKHNTPDSKLSSEATKIVVCADEYLNNWYEKTDSYLFAKRRILMLSGGPGSGKSTTAKLLAASLAKKHKNVIFVPLGEIKKRTEEEYLEKVLQDYINNDTRNLGEWVFGNTDLLILDGLDELAKKYYPNVDEFIQEVNRVSHKYEYMKILLTCRDFSAQTKLSEGNSSKSLNVLTLLDYCVPEINGFMDENNLLKEDKRDSWWENYGDLTNKGYKKLPEPIRLWDREENLTYQPVLNYLIAQVFHDDENAFSGKANLFGLYNTLTKNIYYREYSKDNLATNTLNDAFANFDEYYLFMKRAALEIWHNGGTTAKITQLEDKINKEFGDEQPDVIDKLVVFFLRSQSNDEYEFKHLSFLEYFVVSEIISWFKNLEKNKERHNIKTLRQLLGARPTTDHMLNMFSAWTTELSEENVINKCSSLQTILKELLETGMTLGRKDKTFNFSELYRIETTIEATTFKLLSVLQLRKKGKVRIKDIFAKTRFSKYSNWQQYLHAFENTTGTFSHTIGRFDLSEMDLSEADFDSANLVGTNLNKANLTNANLKGANLATANLFDAELTNADIRRADSFTVSQLESALYDKETTKIDKHLWDEMFPEEEWPWGED